jgi:hypothetical protein
MAETAPETKEETPPPPPPEKKEEAVPPAAPPTEKKPEAPPPIPFETADGKWKIKVNGKELELSKEEAHDYAQQGFAAQQRFAEVARKEKDVNQILGALSKEKKKTLIDIFTAESGGDKTTGRKRFHDFLVENINEFIEEQQLSPEEKAAREKREEIARLDNELKEKREALEKGKLDILAAEEKKKIDAELPEALTKAGLQATEAVQAEVLEEAIRAEEAGINISLEQAAKRIKLNHMLIGKDLLATLTPEEFKAQYPERYEKIVKHYTDSIRAVGASTPASTPKKDEHKERSGQKPRTRADVEAAIMSRCGPRTDF